MTLPRALRRLRGHRGATLIFVAVALVALLSFAALAVDLGYLYVVRNELQNAADSGALAGAQVLYNDQGTSVNAGANTVAANYVASNHSEHASVTVETVKRGHWSFASRTFTENNSLNPVPLWDVTTEELDANPAFINAVQVITRRTPEGTAAPQHFFARIFGADPSQVRASAVAYIGFAGKLKPAEVDQPIAICRQAILGGEGEYTCGVGRMLNSGQNAGHQTAGWTNFSQPCETASASSVRPFVCGSGNPTVLNFGETLGTTNGTVQNVYDGITDCWYNNPAYDRNNDGIPDRPWAMALPVIDCPGGAVGNCSDLRGAVVVNVVWITRNDKNQMKEVPRLMGDWPPVGDPLRDPAGGDYPKCVGTGQQCWDSFVDYFNLKDILNNSDAFYEDKTIYFHPDCNFHDPMGVTGGENYGILAKIPVLVR